MTEIRSWAETTAGLLANGGYRPEDRQVELAERDRERATARAEFEARQRTRNGQQPGGSSRPSPSGDGPEP